MNKNRAAHAVLSLWFGAAAVWSGAVHAGSESMDQMPLLKPTKTFTVKGDEDFESSRGFGEQAPEVNMMNLMMVEGSGMEGMDMNMGSMKMASKNSASPEKKAAPMESHSDMEFQVSISPNPPKVGTNAVEFSVNDPKTGKPEAALKIYAEVSMTTMDMGTEAPAVKETSPGHYRVKVGFGMAGPWALKLKCPGKFEKSIQFNAGGSEKWAPQGQGITSETIK